MFQMSSGKVKKLIIVVICSTYSNLDSLLITRRSLKVFSYSLAAVDAGKNAVLILSAAFDTVDHNVLIARLQHLTGAQTPPPPHFLTG